MYTCHTGLVWSEVSFFSSFFTFFSLLGSFFLRPTATTGYILTKDKFPLTCTVSNSYSHQPIQ